MITEALKQEFYQALIDKNAHYEGVFFVGVKTTGVFCRPTCGARKPKFENCEFHRTAQEALLASFRPCMRCRPLSDPNQVSDLVRALVDAVEADPSKHWRIRDFEELSVDASTARRQFKKRFGMTLLGPMVAIGDEDALYLLEFVDRRGLEREVERLRLKTFCPIIPGVTDPIRSIEAELKAYFEGTLTDFKTPLHLLGSPFQKRVWEELIRIPYGVTRSYADQATAIGKQSAYRAVANANEANQIAIVIPCHRIINSNGDLGGYGGCIIRKQWLINHEKARGPYL